MGKVNGLEKHVHHIEEWWFWKKKYGVLRANRGRIRCRCGKLGLVEDVDRLDRGAAESEMRVKWDPEREKSRKVNWGKPNYALRKLYARRRAEKERQAVRIKESDDPEGVD